MVGLALVDWSFRPNIAGPVDMPGFLWLFFPIVLAWICCWIQDWHKCHLANALQGGWWWIVSFNLLGFAPYLQDFKGNLFSRLVSGNHLYQGWPPTPPTNQACLVCSLSTLPRPHSFPLMALVRGHTPFHFLCSSWLPRKCSISGSRVSGCPKLHSAGCLLWGDCSGCCFIKWSSLDIDSRSLKATCLCGLKGLGLGDWVCLPFESLWQSPPAWHLWLHPCDFLCRWSWLWECWQSSCFILVANWLSLSICSSSRCVATSACWWVSLASASLQSSLGDPISVVGQKGAGGSMS